MDDADQTLDTLNELAPERWGAYFDEMSSELANAEVRIEVTVPPDPPQVEAQGLALQALAYDRRTDTFEVAVAHGDLRVPRVLRHLIGGPRRIAIDAPPTMPPLTIAVDDRDGVRTLIRIHRPADFAG